MKIIKTVSSFRPKRSANIRRGPGSARREPGHMKPFADLNQRMLAFCKFLLLRKVRPFPGRDLGQYQDGYQVDRGLFPKERDPDLAVG